MNQSRRRLGAAIVVLVSLLTGTGVAAARVGELTTTTRGLTTDASSAVLRVEVDAGEGAASILPVSGLRPDDEDPDDDVPVDAFADRTLLVRNASTVTTTIAIAVEGAGPALPDGLRVAVYGEDGGVLLADAAVPRSGELGPLEPGAEHALRIRVRLAHDAPSASIGTTTTLRVTVVLEARPGGAR